MSTTHVQDLQQQIRTLLRRLQLPDTALREDAPPLFKKLDLHAAKRLLQTLDAWNERGIFDDSERLVQEVLLKSPETKQAFLESELALLQQIERSGEDQLHRGPYGLLEYVLPIRVHGAHLHLLRSGKFREKPFTDAEITEIAFASGIPKSAVAPAAAAVPIRSGETLAAFTALHRRLRDAVAAALEAQIQLGLSAAGDAADSWSSLGALAEGAAHQFSNLLSIILGYTSLVLAKTDMPADAVAALNRVAEAAQQGRRLTEEILAAAASNREEEPVCSLHEQLLEAAARLQAAGLPADRFTLHRNAEIDRVPAAPNAVASVLQNMLRHAHESATPGARLRVYTKNIREGGAEQIVVEVAEEGAPAAAGTAQITFPISHEPVRSAAKQVRRRLAPSTIWVADDDPAVRELCRRILEAERHTVESCESGECIRKKLAAGAAPDLLIYDFSMPDLDGVEFCTWLRQNQYRTPVILISGFSAEHPDLKRLLQMRKVFLLQKPFSFRDMTDLVTIAMGETLVG
ncbi:MAG: response regulator [Kiritimatiellae bacterium]|nr:response regulator [Kiritimatiellia bacterium]MDW8458786.1 response regulator [Verrucomicrobiota bacterium]